MKGEHYFELEPGVYIIIIKYYGKGGGYGRWGGKLNMKVQGEKQKRGKGKRRKLHKNGIVNACPACSNHVRWGKNESQRCGGDDRNTQYIPLVRAFLNMILGINNEAILTLHKT